MAAGWLKGIRLIQLIGANARYWTDSSSKIPVDVGAGDAAAGLAIDFYGRFQSEIDKRMGYLTPEGGSSVSVDPVSLMRGAPHRELAVRFIEFVLSEAGQKLWAYRAGEPGGPKEFSLRRLPVRRDFYPGHANHTTHLAHASDKLNDPQVNPYAMAERFTYYPRWTQKHFNPHRKLIRALCIDAGNELRDAWHAIVDAGGPEKQPEAMKLLTAMPPEVTWAGILTLKDPEKTQADWVKFFRHNYRDAREAIQ